MVGTQYKTKHLLFHFLLIAVVCAAFGQSGWAQVADLAPLDMSQIQVPPGFQISVFAQMPSPPRFMLFTPSGDLLVSLMVMGQIASVSPDGQVTVLFQGMQNPHGMAFFGPDLYVAEENQVRVFRDMDPNRSEVIVPNLPTGDHFTRTILFGKDGKMYLSMGSDCNLCIDADPRRAAVTRYNPDGTGQETFATGLRNSVGIRWNPATGQLWGTNNGFDQMGDDLPPEVINIIHQGGNYGWPFCYGNQIPNPLFPPSDPNYCAGTVPPAVQFQAHSAPLGLDFYTGTQFPADFRGDLFVAFHGSYNRTVPTGYKVVRIVVRNGQPQEVVDFAYGWLQLQNHTASGRPVDVLTGPDGALYISDDRANVIYRVVYTGALINTDGIVNAASYSASPAAAGGGIITIFGRNLYDQTFQATSSPLPPSLEGLEVRIGALPAPILYAGRNEVIVQVPFGLFGPTSLLLRTNHGNDSAPINLAPTAPGLFSRDSSGGGSGAIHNASSGSPVTTAAPASAGDVLEIYATGLGPVSEDIRAGSAAPTDHTVSTQAAPTVTIGGVPAQVLFSGLAPGFAGVYQVNVQVPAGVAAGSAAPVVLSIAGQTSNTVTIAAQ